MWIYDKVRREEASPVFHVRRAEASPVFHVRREEIQDMKVQRTLWIRYTHILHTHIYVYISRYPNQVDDGDPPWPSAVALWEPGESMLGELRRLVDQAGLCSSL